MSILVRWREWAGGGKRAGERERKGEEGGAGWGRGKEKTKRRGEGKEGEGSEKGEKGVEEKEMMIDSPRVPMLSKPGPTCFVYAFSFSYRNYEIWSWKSLETLKRILFLMKKKSLQ